LRPALGSGTPAGQRIALMARDFGIFVTLTLSDWLPPRQ
jgi:hypothetical protein